MQTIPLVDLSNPTGVSRAIETACRDIGFMYVAGHAVSPRTIADVRDSVVRYFSQAVDVKLRDRISQDNYRGYIPTGFFTANSGDGSADSYEGYKLHYEVSADDPICNSCDLYGPNKWPAHPPYFKQHLLRYWQECDRVASSLLGAMAEILGTAKGDFLRAFESPLTNMSLLHYPPQSPDDTGFGIHPHKDTDALTILAPDPVGGLLVKCRDSDEWIAAAAPAETLTVNIGDLMELWSGGYFVSTPHKVVNSSGAERYSFPYFAVPRFDTVVKPLKSPQPGFNRPSVDVGEVSKEVWRTNWPDVISDKPHFDLGTLED